jgi:hypothetical protein
VQESLMTRPEVQRLHLPPGPVGVSDPNRIRTGVSWGGAATGAPIEHPIAIEEALKFSFSTRVLHLDTTWLDLGSPGRQVKGHFPTAMTEKML